MKLAETWRWYKVVKVLKKLDFYDDYSRRSNENRHLGVQKTPPWAPAG